MSTVDPLAVSDTVEAIWRYPVKSMGGEAIEAAEIGLRGVLGDRAYALVEQATHRAAVVRTWGKRLMSCQASYTAEPQANQPLPPVEITDPDGVTLRSGDAAIEQHFSAALARELRLLSTAPEGLLVEFPAGTLGGKLADITEAPLAGAAPAGAFFDLACLHLMASSTLAHLQSAFTPGQVDVRRFRPNLVIRTSDGPYVENRWVGRELAIGEELVLRISMACPRCVNVTIEQGDLPANAGILRTLAQQNRVDLGDYGTLPCAGVYADVVQPGRIRQGDPVRWL